MAGVVYFSPVRFGCFTLFAGILVRTSLAQGLLINEVQVAGAPGDAVELFNVSSQPVDLSGIRLVLKDKIHVVNGPRVIPGHGHLVLWCDGDTAAGPDHVGFKLPREHGTLLLLDRDGYTILDAFSWADLPEGVSKGRVRDGERNAAFFVPPSLGSANDRCAAAYKFLSKPRITLEHVGASVIVTLTGEPGARISYTLDGSKPGPDSGLYYATPFITTGPVMISARCFADGAITSETACLTVMPDGPGLPVVALMADPADLWSDKKGIDVEGAQANFSRRGREWEIRGSLQVNDTGASEAHFRIGGSGSRSLPKRSFNVKVDREDLHIPDLGSWSTITLRADASPHAFLRARFMEHVVRATGSRVDMQFSIPVQLLLNSEDRGLYRAMPAKNREWVRSLNDSKAVDLLSGPGLEVITGSAGSFEQGLDLLSGDGPVEALEQCFDLESLIDLACFDLYTGRADHDLNVRCWRSQARGGRWRWILYDVDLWSLAEENSVERMLSSAAHEAPFVPALFRYAPLRVRLLQRMISLLNTTLSPAQATALLDTLFATDGDALVHDYERWSGKMSVPTPEESHEWHRLFVADRPALLLQYLSRATTFPGRELEVAVEPSGAGVVMLNALALTRSLARIHSLAGVPLELSAHAAEGMEFVGWEGWAGESPSIVIDAADVRHLKAVFRPLAMSGRNSLKQAGE